MKGKLKRKKFNGSSLFPPPSCGCTIVSVDGSLAGGVGTMADTVGSFGPAAGSVGAAIATIATGFVGLLHGMLTYLPCFCTSFCCTSFLHTVWLYFGCWN